MELTVNTFHEGLLMDPHPMVLSRESLTDALNATMVTMNGNEVILQNDMGNRRVDNAFLPPGYEPVGMKEHGGIIYIAAYNPITRRGLVGSFPSPEQLQGAFNSNTDMKVELNTNYFTSNENYVYDSNNLKTLKSNFILYKLSDNALLHIGDKFLIVPDNINANDYNTFFENFTNYNNVLGGLIKTPKKKLYTLSVGVLNSLNLFVDITSQMYRWDSDSHIINTTGYTDLYKFNVGYFIPQKSDVNINNDEIQRNILPLNTYKLKLVGPLYVKLELNHINSFDYSIRGNKSEDSEGKYFILDVKTILRYNCPDGYSSVNLQNGNNIYYTLDEGKPTFSGFYLLNNNNLDLSIISEENESKETNNSIYDDDSNLYSADVLKRYKIPYSNEEELYKVIIGIPAISNELSSAIDDIVFLPISQPVELDISKFGSNTVILNTWKFLNYFNSNNITLLNRFTLTFGFEAYPRLNESFTDLLFIFTPTIHGLPEETDIEIEGNDYTLTKYKSGKIYLSLINNYLINTSSKTITINADLSNFFERGEVYQIDYCYNRINSNTLELLKKYFVKSKDSVFYINDNNTEVTQLDYNLWYLATELFNNCYTGNNEIENYCKRITDKEHESFENAVKPNIQLTVLENITKSDGDTRVDDFLSGKDENILYLMYSEKKLYYKFTLTDIVFANLNQFPLGTKNIIDMVKENLSMRLTTNYDELNNNIRQICEGPGMINIDDNISINYHSSENYKNCLTKNLFASSEQRSDFNLNTRNEISNTITIARSIYFRSNGSLNSNVKIENAFIPISEYFKNNIVIGAGGFYAYVGNERAEYYQYNGLTSHDNIIGTGWNYTLQPSDLRYFRNDSSSVGIVCSEMRASMPSSDINLDNPRPKVVRTYSMTSPGSRIGFKPKWHHDLDNFQDYYIQKNKLYYPKIFSRVWWKTEDWSEDDDNNNYLLIRGNHSTVTIYDVETPKSYKNYYAEIINWFPNYYYCGKELVNSSDYNIYTRNLKAYGIMYNKENQNVILTRKILQKEYNYNVKNTVIGFDIKEVLLTGISLNIDFYSYPLTFERNNDFENILKTLFNESDYKLKYVHVGNGKKINVDNNNEALLTVCDSNGNKKGSYAFRASAKWKHGEYRDLVLKSLNDGYNYTPYLCDCKDKVEKYYTNPETLESELEYLTSGLKRTAELQYNLFYEFPT